MSSVHLMQYPVPSAVSRPPGLRSARLRCGHVGPEAAAGLGGRVLGAARAAQRRPLHGGHHRQQPRLPVSGRGRVWQPAACPPQHDAPGAGQGDGRPRPVLRLREPRHRGHLAGGRHLHLPSPRPHPQEVRHRDNLLNILNILNLLIIPNILSPKYF